MRFIQICLLSSFLGCGVENTAPPPFTPQHRETIKQSLTDLDAKVTAETPDALYMSLRNTHVEVRDLGGTIDGSSRTQRDLEDFRAVNEAVAHGFLDPGELEDYRKRLQQALAPNAPSAQRNEFDAFKVTISRSPLRTIFTRKQASEAE